MHAYFQTKSTIGAYNVNFYGREATGEETNITHVSFRIFNVITRQYHFYDCIFISAGDILDIGDDYEHPYNFIYVHSLIFNHTHMFTGQSSNDAAAEQERAR